MVLHSGTSIMESRIKLARKVIPLYFHCNNLLFVFEDFYYPWSIIMGK